MRTHIEEATEFEDAKVVCELDGGEMRVYASQNHNGPVIEVQIDEGVGDAIRINVNGMAVYRGNPWF